MSIFLHNNCLLLREKCHFYNSKIHFRWTDYFATREITLLTKSIQQSKSKTVSYVFYYSNFKRTKPRKLCPPLIYRINVWSDGHWLFMIDINTRNLSGKAGYWKGSPWKKRKVAIYIGEMKLDLWSLSIETFDEASQILAQVHFSRERLRV